MWKQNKVSLKKYWKNTLMDFGKSLHFFPQTIGLIKGTYTERNINYRLVTNDHIIKIDDNK